MSLCTLKASMLNQAEPIHVENDLKSGDQFPSCLSISNFLAGEFESSYRVSVVFVVLARDMRTPYIPITNANKEHY